MFSASAIKLCLGACLLAAAAAAVTKPVSGAPLQHTMPDRTWFGVKRVLILSQFTEGQHDAHGLTAATLCGRVRTIASAGSPVPITCSRLGDPDLDDPSVAVLVIQAALSEAAGGSDLLLFNVRRQHINGLEPSPVYFGSTPRALPLTARAAASDIDKAIGASLREILPWLNQADQFTPRPIRRRGK